MDAIAEAKRLFNETWDLLDKTDRTPQDTILMLHKAHTSCYLWASAESPANDARGEWQVSRVYSVLGMGTPALLHGQRSLDLCIAANIDGLDLAFGYEAVARAQRVLGENEAADAAKEKGVAACAAIAEQEERDYALGELNGI